MSLSRQRLTPGGYLERCRTIARERGGECLSDSYTNQQTPLLWRCREGHEWRTTSANVIRRRSWCPHCAGNARLTIEAIRPYAAAHGGTLLSGEYVNSYQPLRWRCRMGHEFTATARLVQRGRWCSRCRGGPGARYGIERMRAIARDRGGACLSDDFRGARVKLRWRCRRGHAWEAVPNSVLMGTWCPTCAAATVRGRPRPTVTLDDMRAIAAERGGECLSDEYRNSAAKIRWRCANGHEWLATPRAVRQGSWCRSCSHRYSGSIDGLRLLAAEQGGRCLSTAYDNARVPLRWQCAKGHRFELLAGVAKSGAWCPRCAASTRAAPGLESVARLRDSAGARASPPDRSTPTGSLERYSELARAHGGVCLSESYVNAHTKLKFRCANGHEWATLPHCVRHGSWCRVCANRALSERKTAERFERIKRIAEEHGGQCLSHVDMGPRVHLLWRCREGHEWSATPATIYNGKWCPQCRVPRRGGIKWTLEQMQRVALDRGGRCLSKRYVNFERSLRWRCREGHTWRRSANWVVHGGSWCPHCARKARRPLDAVRSHAVAHGGELLSREYVTCRHPLLWRCHMGHEFNMSANHVQKGQWCPRCRGVPRFGIERMRDLARRRGGECLSDEFRAVLAPLRWRCGEGHEWDAKPYGVLRGQWCPKCARQRGQHRPRLTLDDMHEIASARGGRCISTEYLNCFVKLRWRCANGHEWEAKPADVRRGSWCTSCAYRYRSSLDGMQLLAADRGGRCRATVYDNSRVPLPWQCALGHRFELTGGAAKSGAWCPHCEPSGLMKRGRGDDREGSVRSA